MQRHRLLAPKNLGCRRCLQSNHLCRCIVRELEVDSRRVWSTTQSIAVRKLISNRYIEGIVRTDNFSLSLDLHYEPLSTKTDPELVNFFDGFDYRHDIIDRIDEDVRMAIKELACGGSISSALRKLVCYALWGNPVDAYKWFEYSYQKEYMPHRYLPEHVVLGHIPKPAVYKEPRPVTDHSFKKHGEVRARMARANDQGVGTSSSLSVTQWLS